MKSAPNSTPFSCIICRNRTKIGRVTKIEVWGVLSKAKWTNYARMRASPPGTSWTTESAGGGAGGVEKKKNKMRKKKKKKKKENNMSGPLY